MKKTLDAILLCCDGFCHFALIGGGVYVGRMFIKYGIDYVDELIK